MLLKNVPKGRVTSYGALARAAGLRNGARQVVRILHACAEKDGLPWHRVVKKDGSIALREGEGAEVQRCLLEAEGVMVSPDGHIDLDRFGWMPASN